MRWAQLGGFKAWPRQNEPKNHRKLLKDDSTFLAIILSHSLCKLKLAGVKMLTGTASTS